MELPPDFRDLLAAFDHAGVEYLAIGGYAVAHHGRPRFTKDIDLWMREGAENLERAGTALARFGAPATVIEALRHSAAEGVQPRARARH